MIRKLLLTATAFTALSGAALAADLPSRVAAPVPFPLPALTWTGFYVGVNAGGVLLKNTTVQGDEDLSYLPLTGKAIGGTVGGTVGYNWQFGHAVLGAEGDFNWVGAKTDRILGYDSAAWMNTKFTNIYDGYACNDTSEYSGCGEKTKLGLAVGAGVEMMLTRNISAKAEYLFVNMPTYTVSDAYSGEYPYHHDVDMQVFRAGLNYHF